MAPRAGKGKTAQASDAVLRKRMLRVEEHLELAQFAEGEFGANAVISNYINAAKGAGDVICGALSGSYNRSADHFEAVRMLELVGEKDAAKALNAVLQNKTMANYSDVGLSEVQVKQTSRLSVKLVNRARQLAP